MPTGKAVLVFLSVVAQLLALISADHIYTIWTVIPDNTASLDPENVLVGQWKSNANINEYLHRVGRDVSSSTCHSLGEAGNTWYWTATLTDADADFVRSQQIVRLVYDATTGVTTTNHGKSRRLVSRADRFQRRNASAEQSDVDRQLSFISTRPDEPNTLDHPFRYDLRAGAGSRVYIVDQGIFDGAQEWETRNSVNPHARRDRIEWMFAEPYSTHQKEDPDSHGTCVLSVAVGYEFGTAKDADITVVATGSNYLEYERTLDAYSQILDDINRKGLQNKAVVVEAADTAIDPNTANERERSFMDCFAALLRALTTTWATAVVVSQAGEEPCPGPPCIFGDPAHEPYVPFLITVDGADIDSGDYYFLDDDERDKWTTVFGPGVDLDADDERPDDESLSCIGKKGEIIDIFGSSLATDMVGGLMAYYQSLGLSTAQARERLLSNAYRRSRDGPAMIWNGYT